MADDTLTREQAPASAPALVPGQEPVSAGQPSGAPEPAATEPAATEPATVWPAEIASGFRDRWREIQLRFVDDPKAAAGDAEALLAEVLDRFSETLAAQKAEVDRWGDTDELDVERLRTTVRRYRDLLERLLGM